MTPKKSARAGPRSETASLFAETTEFDARDEADDAVTSSSSRRIFHGPAEGERWTAAVQAGIDEAGLGPLLGPLSIGYSAFRAPPGTEDLWTALRTVCTDDVDDDRERLVVADSKLVFTRNPRGERRLERTALAFFGLRRKARRCPLTASEMMAEMSHALCTGDVDTARPPSALAEESLLEPWLPHLVRALPRHGDRGEIDAVVARLADALTSAAIELESCGARIVPVPELNASFAETENKSITHWRATESVLTNLWRTHAHEGLDLAVDRQGGRMRYARLLAETFTSCSIHVLLESPPRSEYLVLENVGGDDTSPLELHPAPESRSSSELQSKARSPRRMRIAFAERAESSSFAVALASCLAKYARETCMDAFNAYFESLQPGLKPTAGYVTDGRRWLEEAGPAIARSGIAREHLVRER